MSKTTAAPLILSKTVGKGRVHYHGTHLGQGSERDPAAFRLRLRRAVADAGLRPALDARPLDAASGDAGSLHVDELRHPATGARYLIVVNRALTARRLALAGGGAFTSLWSRHRLAADGSPQLIPADSAEIYSLDPG